MLGWRLVDGVGTGKTGEEKSKEKTEVVGWRGRKESDLIAMTCKRGGGA